MNILFFSKDVEFSLKDRKRVEKLIKSCVSLEETPIRELRVIFSDDNTLLEINRKFLKHDYFTDIITFPFHDEDHLDGELYISLDTVRANSIKYKENFDKELSRVIIHGILHLCGYDDQKMEDKKIMREKEDFYLSLL